MGSDSISGKIPDRFDLTFCRLFTGIGNDWKNVEAENEKTMSLCNQIGERSDIVEKLNSRRIACSKKVGIFPVYLKPIPGLSRHDDRLRFLYDRLRRHQDGRHVICTAHFGAIMTVFVTKNCAPQSTKPFLPANKPDFSPIIKDCILLSRNRYFTISPLSLWNPYCSCLIH